MSNKRLYVLVRNDLSLPKQSVQAGHAVAQWILENPGHWNNEYLIYLNVKSENDLHKWIYKLNNEKIKYSVFKEPDLNNENTALASVCDGRIFKKLKLMGEDCNKSSP